MGKLLLLLSFVIITILFLGTSFAPQNPDFWLASSASMYQHIREVVALVLALQLVTQPPRHIGLRLIAGTIAIGVGVWALEATYTSSMPLLDTFSFLGSAFAIVAAALERRIIIPDIVLPNNKLAI